MTLVLTLPNRLALCLKDCDTRVKAAFPYSQEVLDYLVRPCFLVGTGEERYVVDESAPEQTAVETTMQVDFVGKPFTATDKSFHHTHEIEAREIAAAAVLYLLRRPQLEFTNTLNDPALSPLPALDGVMWCRPESRSAITLMQRGGIEEAYWGFTISLNIQSIFTVNEDYILVEQE